MIINIATFNLAFNLYYRNLCSAIIHCDDKQVQIALHHMLSVVEYVRARGYSRLEGNERDGLFFVR